MVIIAALAMLMAMCVTSRSDPRGSLIGRLKIAESERGVGLTESYRVWFKVAENFRTGTAGFLPENWRTDYFTPGSHWPGKTQTFYVIPTEFLATVILISAAAVLTLAHYVFRWRRTTNDHRAEREPERDKRQAGREEFVTEERAVAE